MDTKNNNDEDMNPLSPEEIKAIGEIELGPAKHEVFLNKHYKKLLWGGIALGIAGGSVIAYLTHQQDRLQFAGAEAVSMLENAGDNAYNAESAETIHAKYGDTPSSATAYLVEGMAKLQGDHPEEGAAFLQSNVIDNAAAPDILRARALSSVALFYQGEGKKAEARQMWERVAAMADNPYTALACLQLGDLFKSEGNIEAARTFYNTAKERCGTSALVTDKVVEMRLLLLEVDAPEPVSPEPAKEETRDGATPPSGGSAFPSAEELFK